MVFSRRYERQKKIDCSGEYAEAQSSATQPSRKIAMSPCCIFEEFEMLESNKIVRKNLCMSQLNRLNELTNSTDDAKSFLHRLFFQIHVSYRLSYHWQMKAVSLQSLARRAIQYQLRTILTRRNEAIS